MEKLDEDMKNLFYSVGISDNDEVDKETIDFIYDFVEKNGGIEQVKKEMMIKPPPPPPPSGKCPVCQKFFFLVKKFCYHKDLLFLSLNKKIMVFRYC